MRLSLFLLGLLYSSPAFAQDGPGGPKIFKELDTMTSTEAATSSVGEAPPPAPRTVMSKQRGILGINVVNLGGTVRVKSLKPDGAAEKAGIKKWDTIISLDGKPVKDRQQYVESMAGRAAGESVMVEWQAVDGELKASVIVLEGGRVAIRDPADAADDEGRVKPTAKKSRRERRGHVVRPKRPRTRKWYGWQGLASDAASLVLVAFTTQSAVAGGIGLVGFGIGAPLTHFFHENVGRGLISMLMRTGVPALTVLGTIGICDEARICSDATPLVVVGALAIFVAIPAIDAAALSWQKIEPEVQTSVNVSFAPTITPTEGGVTVGLGAAF